MPARCTGAAPQAHERLAERLARGAERDRLDRLPVARDGAQAKMIAAGADGHDVGQAMARQGEHRLGIARAVRSGRLQAMGKRWRRRVGRQRRIDREASVGARCRHRFAEPLFQKGAPLA